MYSKNVWKMGTILLLSLFISISIAQAEPIDITYCLSLTTTMVSETQELSIHSFDFKGIARSNLENKAFDNLTFHGIGVGRDLGTKESTDTVTSSSWIPMEIFWLLRIFAPLMPSWTLIGISYRAPGNGRGSRGEENFGPQREENQ